MVSRVRRQCCQGLESWTAYFLLHLLKLQFCTGSPAVWLHLQVVLGDLPVSMASRRAAEGIWAALLPRVLAGALLAAATAASAFSSALGPSPNPAVTLGAPDDLNHAG